MKKFFTSTAVALTLCFAAAPVFAQTGNCSNCTQGNNTSSSIAGGVFSPASAGTSGNSAPVNNAVSGAFGSLFNGGSVSGGGISVGGPAVAQLQNIMSGGAVPTAYSSALNGSGASAATVNNLTNALSALGANPSGPALANAVTAFNALVGEVTNAATFSTPQFLAIFAALSNMVAVGNVAAGS
ncbi:MAG TPA: hypothetical protein VIJ16_11720 [Gemmatimonadaceae bacterium]